MTNVVALEVPVDRSAQNIIEHLSACTDIVSLIAVVEDTEGDIFLLPTQNLTKAHICGLLQMASIKMVSAPVEEE